MNSRLKEKIDEIRKYLSELEGIQPAGFEEYFEDVKTKAACERFFENIIEAVVDLVFLLLKEKKLKMPEEDAQAFFILQENGFISPALAERLKEAKGMRNILAHEYGIVDDELVYHAVSEELSSDVEEFLEAVEKLL